VKGQDPHGNEKPDNDRNSVMRIRNAAFKSKSSSKLPTGVSHVSWKFAHTSKIKIQVCLKVHKRENFLGSDFKYSPVS
jgi:hypothetical protein